MEESSHFKSDLMTRHELPGKLLLCLSFLAMVLVCSHAMARHPAYIHYSVDQGMGSSFIYHGARDQKGFIWFGSESGVNRFDGHDFEYFSTADGLPDNEILYVKPDSKGRIWFLGYNGKIAFWENEKLYVPSNHPLLALVDLGAPVHQFLEDRQGKIWLGSREGLHVLDLEKETYRPELTRNQGGIWEDPEGKIWVWDLEGGYRSLESGQRIRSAYISDPSRRPIPLPGGRVVRPVREGLVEFRNGAENLILSYDEVGDIGRIVNVALDSKDRMLLATTNGAYVYEKRKDGSAAVVPFANGVFVSGIFEDEEGNIWATTLGDGVYFFPSLEVLTMDKSSGLSSDKIFTLEVDSEGALWVGSDAPVVDIKRSAGWEKLDSEYGIQHRGRVVDMYEDRGGDVWILKDEHLACISSGQIRHSPVVAKCIAEYAPDTFLLSYYRGVIVATKREILQAKPPVSNFINAHRIYHLRAFGFARGAGRMVYMATNQGVFVFDGKTVSRFMPENDLLGRPARGLVTDAEGRLWVATYGWGLLCVEGDRVMQFTRANGLTGDVCNALHCDGQFVWVATNGGLSRVEVANNHEILAIRKMNGLVSNEVLDVATTRDTVWVATSKGLTFFAQSFDVADSEKPRIHLLDVKAGNESLKHLKNPGLDHDRGNVSFHFRGIKLKNDERLTYRYQLSGLDELWRETEDHRVEFLRLSPGDYEFRVVAVSSAGTESAAAARFQFSIATPFFQQAWVKAVLLFIVAGLIGLAFYLQIFSFSREKVRTYSRNLLKKLAADEPERFLYFKTTGKQIKIPEKEVLYFRSAGDYIDIHTEEKKYLVRKTMKKLEEDLDPKSFVRIHRSIIVRVDRVQEIEGKLQVTIHGEALPIGKKYQENIDAIFREFHRPPGPKI